MKVFELYPLRGHSVLLTGHRKDNGRKERPMSLSKRYANKQAKASTRRRPSAPAARSAPSATGRRGPPPGSRSVGPARDASDRDRRPLTPPPPAPGHDGREEVSRALWLSDPLGTLSRAWLGHARACPAPRRAAQTLLAQAAATLGPGGVGADLAPCGPHESGHPEPLAVDLGLG